MKKIEASFYFSSHALLFSFSIALLCFLLPSCSTTRLPLYFENLPKDTTLRNLVTKDFELKIKKGDLLSIGVSSSSAENSANFNAPQSVPGSASTTGSGFLVDINGNILYPKLGFIPVEGLTRDELRTRLLKDLLPYLKDPVVTVNYVNHQITVLGEVGKPQLLTMSSETVTILDAISLSGDLKTTARKDNVLVIRDSGTIKEFKRLNLNNSSVFSSAFYYLKPNDIVYVEPEKVKKASNIRLILSYVTAGLSIITLILTRIIK